MCWLVGIYSNMQVNVCACVRVCMCVYIRMCIYVHIYVCVFVCVMEDEGGGRGNKETYAFTPLISSMVCTSESKEKSIS